MNAFVAYLATLLALLVSIEAGFRLGRRFRRETTDPVRSQIGTIQGAMFGLLALLLAFSFAMAASRYDARKSLVLQESNAIGTALLRTKLLAEPQRGEAAALLREYVEARLRLYGAGRDEAVRKAADAQSEALHARLWALGVAVAERDPRAVTSALFLESLNEVIDLHTKRTVAVANHVPESILFLLYAVALLALGLTGYGCGLGGRRALLPNATAAVLVAAVIFVILDLDRPARGLITVSQKSMLELRESWQRAPK